MTRVQAYQLVVAWLFSDKFRWIDAKSDTRTRLLSSGPEFSFILCCFLSPFEGSSRWPRLRQVGFLSWLLHRKFLVQLQNGSDKMEMRLGAYFLFSLLSLLSLLKPLSIPFFVLVSVLLSLWQRTLYFPQLFSISVLFSVSIFLILSTRRVSLPFWT